MDYQRDEHRVHLLIYHLVWCPKRRKPILTGQLKDRLIQLVEQKCAEKGWDIIEFAVQPDHVHLFVRVWPSDSVAEIVKELKGFTSFSLRQEFKPHCEQVTFIVDTELFRRNCGQCERGNHTALYRSTERSLRAWPKQPPPSGKH